MNFGNNLKFLRKEKGLTGKQIESHNGYSQSYISSLESGRAEPRLQTIIKLAAALGVTPAQLLSENPRDAAASIQWAARVGSVEERIPLSVSASPEAAYILVNDAAMENVFHPNDKVIADPGLPYKPGDFVVARTNAAREGFVRRYSRRNSNNPGFYELLPLVAGFAVEDSDSEGIEIIGQAVAIIRNI